MNRSTLYLFLIILLGVFVRLDFLIAGGGVLDGDEAIIGLMAKHIKEGSNYPIFFYGQPYMGSIESYLAAVVFGVFGISGYGLLIVPTIISILLIPLVYLMARRFVSQGAALLATLYFAVPPQPLIIWSIKARGGFIETVFIGAVVFLMLARAIRAELPPRSFALGLVLGICWWINFQALYFIVLSGLVYLAIISRCRLPYYESRLGLLLRHAVVGTGGFLIGSLPFWWYNLNHNFASFGTFVAGGSSDRLSHLHGFFSEALPILLGARREWSYVDVFPNSSLLAYVILALMLVVYLSLRVGELVELVTSRQFSRAAPIEIFPIFVVLVSAIFIVSSYGWLTQAPRYLLPIYIAIPVLFGFTAVNMNRYFAIIYVVAALSLNLSSLYLGGRAIGGQPFVTDGERVSPDHKELNHWLADNHISFIRTNYWIGYRVAFETEERVRFVRFQEPGFSRIPAYELEGMAQPTNEIPYVLTAKQGEIVKRALRLIGTEFLETTLSGYTVLFNLKDALPAEKTALNPSAVSSSNSPEMLGQLDDDNPDTRWASAAPQSAGMFIDVKFQHPKEIVGISYDFTGWPADYPRGLNLEILDAKGGTARSFGPEDFEALRYLADGRSIFKLRFDEIAVSELRLSLSGAHQIFDWSIGELDLMVNHEGA